jgi:glycosyltransferase involved in cell wall biosynthesis
MSRPAKIGWVLDTSPHRTHSYPWDAFSPVARIRYAGIARHLDHAGAFRMERYRPWGSYDAVVFLKMMSDPAFVLAQKLKRQGTRVIFDANVNYYEAWGNFPVADTRPTDIQTAQACRMTELADAVVADSSALQDVCLKINPRTYFVPDAVDTEFFRPREPGKHRAKTKKLTLIWSGIGKKAYHLELIEQVLGNLKEQIHLILIPAKPTLRDVPAPVLQRLQKNLNVSQSYFHWASFPDALAKADVVISPKDLGCSYEQSHTEYKITLGMAMGLPALASPQRSYVEAIGDGLGGAICTDAASWHKAIEQFSSDDALLRAQGLAAREKVVRLYSIPVVAERYRHVLDQVLCNN